MSFWRAVGTGVVLVGGALLLREAFFVVVRRRQVRKNLYLQASIRAHETGKKLLVVGNPEGSPLSYFIGSSYGCGDLCADVSGCPSCDTHMMGRLEEVLPTLNTNEWVVFANDLEFSRENIGAVLGNLDRISGGDLFVATLEPTSLTALLHPRSRRRIFEAPPTSTKVRYRPLPWHPEVPGVTEIWVALPRTQERHTVLASGAAPNLSSRALEHV